MSIRKYLLTQFNQAIEIGNKNAALRFSSDLVIRNLATESDLELFKNFLPEIYEHRPYGKFEKDITLNYYQRFELLYGRFQNNYSAFLKSQEEILKKGIPVINFLDEEDFNSFVQDGNDFISKKINIQDNNCDDLMLTKKEVIKCASSTDQEINQVNNIIDDVFHNKYFDSLFSLLAILIAEGVSFNFLFSDKQDPQCFKNELHTNNDLSTFVHESYHALQELIFYGKDFYTNEFESGYNHSSQEGFLQAVKDTCINIIKLLSLDNKITIRSDLPELIALIKNELSQNKVDMCHLYYDHQMLENMDLATINEIQQQLSLHESASLEEFNYFLQNHCPMLEAKYDLPVAVLERISYFFSEYDSNHGDEIMPSIFELIALGVNEKAMNIFSPMLDNFSNNIQPIIDSYKVQHIENYCASLLDEQNKQCLEPNYGLYDGRCVLDFLDI